jgi:hypothetical protein
MNCENPVYNSLVVLEVVGGEMKCVSRLGGMLAAVIKVRVGDGRFSMTPYR